MSYKNPKELLIAATALPAAIEAKLPAGAPSLSTMLVDAANKMPTLPDFPFELPDLPAVPEFPGMPTPPAGGEALARRRYVAEVTPVTAAPTPAVGAAPRSKRYLF